LASITEYPVPAGSPAIGNGLSGITGGPDGNVYFTDTLNNAIGQIIPSGVISELPLPPPANGGGFFGSGLDGITLGSNDKLVFTESTQGALGEITTTGSYNPVPIDPTGNDTGQEPDQITTSSDGTLWFTEDGATAIGELTTAGVFHQYPVPNATNGGIIGPSMKGIAVGSDGNIWFTNWGSSGDFIGMMTPSGNLTEFPLPFGTDPYGITSGPDGNLWFTAYGSNTIDVMSTSGMILHQYGVTATAGSGGLGDLNDITVGSDNNVYFTAGTGYIGKITASGVVTMTPVSTTVTTVPGASGPQPLAITSGRDGNICFTEPWNASIGVLKIVTTPSPLPTIKALAASTASAATGQSVTLTATVSDLSAGGATPNGGTVTFSDQSGPIDSQTLEDGLATFTTSSLRAGTDTITAFYVGTAGFAPSATGRIVTATGDGSAAYAGDGGPATDAELNEPCGVAFDSEGDMYIADYANNMVREVIKATGDIITVAGDGKMGYSGAGGLATDGKLDYPFGLAVDSAGDLFISDVSNNVVREVTSALSVAISPPSALPTVTALRTSTASAALGQSITFTATVSDLSAGGATPNGGTITFSDQNSAIGSATLVDGVAMFTTSGLSAGTDTITASYAGTVNFAPSTAGTIVTISKATSATSATSTSATFSPVSQTVLLGAKVTSGSGVVNEGTETFTILSGSTVIGTAVTVNVGNDAASASYVLPAGTSPAIYTIRAVYKGNVDFFGSTDSSHSLTVDEAATSTAADSISATFSTAIEYVQLGATVTSPSGTVNEGTETFTILSGNTVIGTPVTVNVGNGAASASYFLPAGTSAGTYTIMAVYNGNADFFGSTDTSHSLTVGEAATPPPIIISEKVVTAQKLNNRGKPKGKSVFSGFALQDSEAMNSATSGLETNYTVDSLSIKRTKGKSAKFAAVHFSEMFDPSSNTVDLKISGNNPFAKGGQVTINDSVPNGVSSQEGVPLNPSYTTFAISVDAKRIRLG
jgi:streptogramin lyase